MRINPQQKKVLTEKKQNLFISEHGRVRREGGTRCIRDPQLDNLKTRIVHIVISESGSSNKVEDPPKRSRGQWRPGRNQRPQGKGKVVDTRPRASSLFDNWHIIHRQWCFYWLSCRCVQVPVCKTRFQRRTSLVLHTEFHNRALCVSIYNSYSLPVVKYSQQTLVCLVGFSPFSFTATTHYFLLRSESTGNVNNPRLYRFPWRYTQP